MRHCRAVAVLGAVLGLASGCEGTEAPRSADEGFRPGLDDSVRSPLVSDPELCGGCDPRCFRVHDCPTGRDLSAGNCDSVRFDLDRDGLVLGGLLWWNPTFIANSGEGTVSKVDPGSRREVGRYYVGHGPSAVAVDRRGNGYVVMSGERVETVAKIAGDWSNCVDRNRNGRIDTSSGSRVLGRGRDECVMWTSSEAAGACPRAVAIDQSNRVWVGGWCTRQFHVLDPDHGSLIRTVPVSASAYDAAIGSDGVLWYSGRSHSVIQSIDTETFEVGLALRPSCGGDLDGIVVDLEDRVWIVCARQPCRAARFDPRSGSWLNICDIPDPRTARDAAIDWHGNVWISAHDSWIGYSGPSYGNHYDASTGALLGEHAIPDCDGATGIASGFEGYIWFVCTGSWSTGALDPDTGRTAHVEVGASPYTYADFTGFLRHAVTGPEGRYLRLHDAALVCHDDERVRWSQLYFEVETPDETRVLFKGRTAGSVSDLGATREVLLGTVPGDWSPLDIGGTLVAEGVPDGQRYFEVEVVLQSLDSETSPVFRTMDMVFYCECTCDEDRSCSAACDCDGDC